MNGAHWPYFFVSYRFSRTICQYGSHAPFPSFEEPYSMATSSAEDVPQTLKL